MTAEGLVHTVREPAGEPEGAIFLLHGRRADESDVDGLFDIVDPRRRLVGVAPRGPLQLPPRGSHWYDMPTNTTVEPRSFGLGFGALTAFLDGWLAERGIGWERTIMGGFSQGTVMAYATALGDGRPRPAGVLAMSGFVPSVDGWAPDLAARRGLPVLVTHGLADHDLSADLSRSSAQRLRAAGLDVEECYTAGGHHVDPRAIPVLVDWVARTLS